MSAPEREPESYDANAEPRREVRPADRVEREETRLEPVERERYIGATRLVNVGPTLRWGPIWGGAVVTFGLLFFLGLLGAAFGLTTLRTAVPSSGQIVTASVIWGAVILVVSFFVGGWIAGRATGSPGTGVSGFVVGSVLWAVSVTLATLATAFGVGGAATAALNNFGIPTINSTAGNVATAQSAAIGTLIGLVLAYLASIAGAAAGVGAAPREFE